MSTTLTLLQLAGMILLGLVALAVGCAVVITVLANLTTGDLTDPDTRKKAALKQVNQHHNPR